MQYNPPTHAPYAKNVLEYNKLEVPIDFFLFASHFFFISWPKMHSFPAIKFIAKWVISKGFQSSLFFRYVDKKPQELRWKIIQVKDY